MCTWRSQFDRAFLYTCTSVFTEKSKAIGHPPVMNTSSDLPIHQPSHVYTQQVSFYVVLIYGQKRGCTCIHTLYI